EDFAYVIARACYFDIYHELFLLELMKSTDETLSAIAHKSIKEVRYHKLFSTEWVKRLGDGTEESHQKMQQAIDDYWPYTDELFQPAQVEKEMAEAGIGVDITKLKEPYYNALKSLLETARLEVPDNPYFQKGGKQGIHTEHMGYILSDMQYMQLAYPNMEW
ncbi:MAG: 1,2-phenylacetyl-CoA epoxidase subunit PaaC, partial [Bacteroidota bacterium]